MGCMLGLRVARLEGREKFLNINLKVFLKWRLKNPSYFEGFDLPNVFVFFLKKTPPLIYYTPFYA